MLTNLLHVVSLLLMWRLVDHISYWCSTVYMKKCLSCLHNVSTYWDVEHQKSVLDLIAEDFCARSNGSDIWKQISLIFIPTSSLTTNDVQVRGLLVRSNCMVHLLSFHNSGKLKQNSGTDQVSKVVTTHASLLTPNWTTFFLPQLIWTSIGWAPT